MKRLLIISFFALQLVASSGIVYMLWELNKTLSVSDNLDGVGNLWHLETISSSLRQMNGETLRYMASDIEEMKKAMQGVERNSEAINAVYNISARLKKIEEALDEADVIRLNR